VKVVASFDGRLQPLSLTWEGTRGTVTLSAYGAGTNISFLIATQAPGAITSDAGSWNEARIFNAGDFM